MPSFGLQVPINYRGVSELCVLQALAVMLSCFEEMSHLSSQLIPWHFKEHGTVDLGLGSVASTESSLPGHSFSLDAFFQELSGSNS